MENMDKKEQMSLTKFRCKKNPKVLNRIVILFQSQWHFQALIHSEKQRWSRDQFVQVALLCHSYKSQSFLQFIQSGLALDEDDGADIRVSEPDMKKKEAEERQ